MSLPKRNPGASLVTEDCDGNRVPVNPPPATNNSSSLSNSELARVAEQLRKK